MPGIADDTGRRFAGVRFRMAFGQDDDATGHGNSECRGQNAEIPSFEFWILNSDLGSPGRPLSVAFPAKTSGIASTESRRRSESRYTIRRAASGGVVPAPTLSRPSFKPGPPSAGWPP